MIYRRCVNCSRPHKVQINEYSSYVNYNVSIICYRPSTPEPEHVEEGEEDEEEVEDGVVSRTDERNREENSRPNNNPVEYVTIRRLRPSTSADSDSTTPR
jgi:hypothetical protein